MEAKKRSNKRKKKNGKQRKSERKDINIRSCLLYHTLVPRSTDTLLSLYIKDLTSRIDKDYIDYDNVAKYVFNRFTWQCGKKRDSVIIFISLAPIWFDASELEFWSFSAFPHFHIFRQSTFCYCCCWWWSFFFLSSVVCVMIVDKLLRIVIRFIMYITHSSLIYNSSVTVNLVCEIFRQISKSDSWYCSYFSLYPLKCTFIRAHTHTQFPQIFRYCFVSLKMWQIITSCCFFPPFSCHI